MAFLLMSGEEREEYERGYTDARKGIPSLLPPKFNYKTLNTEQRAKIRNDLRRLYSAVKKAKSDIAKMNDCGEEFKRVMNIRLRRWFAYNSGRNLTAREIEQVKLALDA